MNIIACLPRTLSSTVMRGCSILGLPLKVTDYGQSVNDGGDFECEESSLGVDTADPKYQHRDLTLKIILHAFLFKSKIDPTAKIILLLRSPAGVVASQGRIGMGQPRPEIRRMNYWRLMAQARNWITTHVNPVLIVDTDDLLVRPKFWFAKIAEFTGRPAKAAGKAAAIIEPKKSITIQDAAQDDAQAVYQELKALCYTNT